KRTSRTPGRVCTAGSIRWRAPGGSASSLGGFRTRLTNPREDTMPVKHARILALTAGSALAALPALAADVTPERLINPEPQNWLMNHRTYDGQRYSPLDRINKANAKGLRLAYAVALGGSAGNEFIQATPLAEDGFLYVTDSWGVLYKIDGT